MTDKAADAVQIITSAIDTAPIDPEQPSGRLRTYHIWREPLRCSASLMMLGAALAKQ